METKELENEVLTADGPEIKNTFVPDIGKIKEIYEGLENKERRMDGVEYLKKQAEEALSEENKILAAAAYGKDVSSVTPDEAMMFYSKSGGSERFALENLRFRQDKTLEEIKKYYKKYLPDEE